MRASGAEDRGDKAESVLRAATSAFLEHGFSAATTDMIQRKARVSKATLYACFPNKEAMFAAVVERQCSEMTVTIREIRASSGDIVRILTDIGAAYLKIILSPDGLALYRVVVAETSRFPDLGREFFLAGPNTVATMVAACLNDAAQKGEIDVQSVGVEAAAALFASMVRGQAQIEVLTHPDSSPSDAQIDYWARLAVTTFMRAFGVRKSD